LSFGYANKSILAKNSSKNGVGCSMKMAMVTTGYVDSWKVDREKSAHAFKIMETKSVSAAT
jgi:hypothetical protein